MPRPKLGLQRAKVLPIWEQPVLQQVILAILIKFNFFIHLVAQLRAAQPNQQAQLAAMQQLLMQQQQQQLAAALAQQQQQQQQEQDQQHGPQSINEVKKKGVLL